MKEMRELKADIKLAVDRELIRANGVHVPKFVDENHRSALFTANTKRRWRKRQGSKLILSVMSTMNLEQEIFRELSGILRSSEKTL